MTEKRQLTYEETKNLIDAVTEIDRDRNTPPPPIIGTSPMMPPNPSVFKMLTLLKEFGSDFVLDKDCVMEHIDIDCEKCAMFFYHHAPLTDEIKMFLHIKWAQVWQK